MMWKKYPLGKICDVRDGTHNSPKYVTEGFPLVTSKNIKDGYLDLQDVNLISETDFNEINKRSKVNKGDILMPMIGTIGNPIIVDHEPNFAIKNVCLLKYSDAIVPKYLLYLLKSNLFERNLLSVSRGGTQKFISLSDIRKFEIPLPPIEIQKQISDTLDKADSLRRKDQELLQKYDKLAQSIFYEMFGDPVRNEKEWPVVSVASLLSTAKEGTKCGPFGSALKKEDYQESGIPVWVMNNIVDSEFLEDGCLYIDENKFENLLSYNAEPGDIIISRAGTVGKMCVVTTTHDRSIISTNLIRLSLNRNVIHPKYFVSLFKFFGSRVGRLRTGADGAFTHMNTSILCSLSIPLPPIDRQTDFVHTLGQIRDSKALIRDNKIDTLFNALLNRYFA